MIRELVIRLACIVFCTLFSTWQYLVITLATCGDCMTQMERIVQFRGDAPFAYRLLTPAILVVMGNTPQAFAIFHLALFALFFILLWIWARRWRVNPVLVLLLTTCALVIMLQTFYFSSYTLTEWVLLLCALCLLPRWSLSDVSTGR